MAAPRKRKSSSAAKVTLTFPGYVQTFSRGFGSGRVALLKDGSTTSIPFTAEAIADGSDLIRSGDEVVVRLVDPSSPEPKVASIQLAKTSVPEPVSAEPVSVDLDFSFQTEPEHREVAAHFSKEKYIETGARLSF